MANPEEVKLSREDAYKARVQAEKELVAEEKRRAELATKNVQRLKEEEETYERLTDLAKSLNTTFDKYTKTFGKNVEQLSLEEKIQKNVLKGEELIRAYDNDIMALAEEMLNAEKKRGDAKNENAQKSIEDAATEEKKQDIQNKSTQTLQESASIMNVLLSILDALGGKLRENDTLQKNITENVEKQAEAQNKVSGGIEKEKQTRADLEKKMKELIAGKEKAVVSQQKLLGAQTLHNGAMGIANKLSGNMLGNFMNMVKGGNPYVIAAKALTAILEVGVDNFLAFDKAATQTRKDLGLMRGDANGIEKTIKTITLETMDMGVQYQDVANTVKSLSNSFSSTLTTNKELVKDITLMSTQLGVAADDSAEFLKTLGGVTGKSADSNKNMLGFAQQMAKASGVPLGHIMKDVSDAARNSSAYIKADAVGLVKAAAAARLMGITLEKAAATSKQLLDFNTSIADEMEASVLMGKNINLQHARELAYKGKTVEANAEILRITKQLDFSKMDPMQMESFAKATGKSVGELQDMIEADKRQQALRELAAKDPSVKKQLDDLQKMKDMKKADAENVGKQALLELQRQSNQERMNALQDKFNQLMAQLAEPVMDIVEPLLSIATYILPAFIKYGLPIVGWFKMLGIEIKIITKATTFLRNMFAGVMVFLRGFGTVGKFLATTFGKFAGFFGIVGKFLGPIGLIINAFQFINALMKRWKEAPDGFVGGLKAIGLALYDVFLKPFVDVWNWVKNIFVGKSPSKLGLGILEGIKAVGGMIFNALTFPYRMLWQFVKKIFSSLGGLIMAPLKGVMRFVGSIFGGGAKTAEPATGVGTTTTTTANQPAANNPNAQIIQKLDELINLMKSGGIAVNIDGNRASYLLAKNTTQRGGLGAIK